MRGGALVIGRGKWGQNILRTLGELHVRAEVCGRGLLPPTRGIWDDPSYVFIATPASTHYHYLKVALENGVPAFVEKPLCLSSAEAHELVELHARHPVPVLIDHTYLFHPAYRALKAEWEKMGKPSSSVLEFVSGGDGPVRGDVCGLWDYGAHDVAMAIDLASGVPWKNPKVYSVNTIYPHQLCFDDGVAVHYCARFAISNRRQSRARAVEISVRERTRLSWDDEAPTDKVQLHEAEGGFRSLTYDVAERPLTNAIKEFLRRVEVNDCSPDSLQLGAQVVNVLEQWSPPR